jgi:hypothetical protein
MNTLIKIASIPELAGLLYPLGLFNQRANSLIRFSQQYVELGWPLSSGSPVPQSLDVQIFYGAGRYASDSFRIFSPLLPGRGAPEGEKVWLEKRERAIHRWESSHKEKIVKKELDICEVCEWMSDEEDEEKEEEEWRKVRPTGMQIRFHRAKADAQDKELRRYLVSSTHVIVMTWLIHRSGGGVSRVSCTISTPGLRYIAERTVDAFDT